MAETVVFLFGVVMISLSGVMAPGPMTAATICLGVRHKNAGLLIAVGHGLVEMPLVLLLVYELGDILGSTGAEKIITISGGVVLLLMGIMMLKTPPEEKVDTRSVKTPLMTGIVLSATNPYFIVWWLTVGLKLALQASRISFVVLLLFIAVHYLCDFIWLGALSMASHKGAKIFGDRMAKTVMVICALVMIAFGGIFFLNAVL